MWLQWRAGRKEAKLGEWMAESWPEQGFLEEVMSELELSG